MRINEIENQAAIRDDLCIRYSGASANSFLKSIRNLQNRSLNGDIIEDFDNLACVTNTADTIFTNWPEFTEACNSSRSSLLKSMLSFTRDNAEVSYGLEMVQRMIHCLRLGGINWPELDVIDHSINTIIKAHENDGTKGRYI